MGDTLMPVKVEIFIQASADSHGEGSFLGPTTLEETRNWLNSLSIGSTATDTWQRCLDTEQTTMASLTLWPSTQSWNLDLSPNFRLSTLTPSQHTNDGTTGLRQTFGSMAVWTLLLVAGVGSLVGATMTLLLGRL